MSGTNLQSWLDYGQLELEVYLPESNSLNPNTFFLGLAEITTEWTWAGGLFGTPSGTSGWIRVVFPVQTVYRRLNPNGTYLMYIASFHQDANGNKTPLREAFHLAAFTSCLRKSPPLPKHSKRASQMIPIVKRWRFCSTWTMKR